MSKVEITVTADEVSGGAFQYDLIVGIAKQLHEYYNNLSPSRRGATIQTPMGTVKFVWISKQSFQLGSHTYHLENGKWRVSLFDHGTGLYK